MKNISNRGFQEKLINLYVLIEEINLLFKYREDIIYVNKKTMSHLRHSFFVLADILFILNSAHSYRL